MTIYHSAVVPGLLQIGDYTRGIHEKGVPQLNAAKSKSASRNGLPGSNS